MPQGTAVRVWTVRYRAHNGLARNAYVVLPSGYGPRNNPPVPLIISPHGRGIPARSNVNFWGDLPARGNFAVINPDGYGRKLPLHSWGWRRQIDDLANMQDRKSTRLNSSHANISYAVFCLQKKTETDLAHPPQ